jgi:tetratricopeptide (TPR) repeat protein
LFIVRIHLFIFIFLLSFYPSFADEWDLYFKNANLAYTEGKYQEAINFYRQIIDHGFESGELYFNLANSYYKMDEIGKAILYYEKTTQYLEGDEALNQNLDIARLKVIDKIEPIPELFLNIWWNKIIHLFSLKIFAWLCLGLFIISLLIIILYIIFNKYFLRRVIWILSFLFIIVLILFISRIFEYETEKNAVILADKVSVVGEPTITATEVFILHEGTKVKVNRIIGEWAEISIADGKTGWLQLNTLGII